MLPRTTHNDLFNQDSGTASKENSKQDDEVETDDDICADDAAASRRFANSYASPAEEDDVQDFAPPYMCADYLFFATY